MQAISFNRIALLALLIAIFTGCEKPERKSASVEVSIDAVLPLTGVAAEYGNYYKEALSSFRTANKLDETWDLSIQDSKSNPKDAVSAARLANSPMQPRIIFTELSSVSMALAPVAVEQNALLVAIAATPKLADFSNVLRIYPEAGALATQFRQGILSMKQGARNIGIFYVNDDFGASVSEALDRVLQEGAMNLAFKRAIPNTTDAPSEVDRLKDQSIDLIVVVGIGQPMGSLIRAIRERLPDVPVLASPEFPFASVIGQIPKELLSDISYLAFPEISPQDAKPLRAELGRDINPLDVLVYDAAEVIRQSLSQINNGVTGVELAARIRGKTFQSLGRSISIDSAGNIVYSLSLKAADSNQAK